jgi:hypothetical protein
MGTRNMDNLEEYSISHREGCSRSLHRRNRKHDESGYLGGGAEAEGIGMIISRLYEKQIEFFKRLVKNLIGK